MASVGSESQHAASHSEAPTVSWFELFYDLVVVAAVSLTNDVFLAHPSATTAVTAAASMTALAWAWFLTTLYNNLYPGQDILRRALLLLQMAAIVVAGLAVDQEHGISNKIGLAAYGTTLLIVAVLIVWGSWTSRRPVPWGSITPLVVATAICWIGSLDDISRSGSYLAVAVAASMIPILLRQYTKWQSGSQLRLAHLRERLGLFVLIILGEGFAQLVQALHGRSTIPRGDLFALMFLLSFSVWWIYFDGAFSRHTDLGMVRWRLTLLAHLTLVFGIAGTLDILILLTAQEGTDLGDAVMAYFVACLATVLFSFAALAFTAKGRLGPAGWVQVGSGVAILVVGLVFVPRDQSEVSAIIGLSAALVIGNAVLAVWADEAGVNRRWRTSLGPALRGDADAADEGGIRSE